MFDNPDVAKLRLMVRGPWAVGIACSERARALLADEIGRAVPVVMREIGNRDGYGEQYQVTVEVLAKEETTL